ncbi:uncharacterized protein LOC143178267 [Calliopsis andreniformis]|uniref:uncharacterized protein LOC143178267 n=1 Tax=Calliopsis andreniformis TaxID=337506 RepID=UPI003FCD06C7
MNKKHETCASLKDEKLYIMDIFVDSVSLQAERLDKVDPTLLGVDLKFIDMPLFRIFQADFELTKPDRSKEVSREGSFRTVYFNAGKIYVFTRNPGELIEKIRAKPLLLDVYIIKEIVICPEEVVKTPLGNSKIPMPGCLCDHVMMSSNDIYHLPKSYQIKNTFGLVDEEHKPSGYITLFFRLTCFGTYTTNTFSIVQQKLMFKNSGSFNEFLCTKVPYEDEEDRRAAEASSRFCMPDKDFGESELDTPPRPVNIAGLVFVCKELAQRDGYVPEVIPTNFPPKIPQTVTEERKFDVDKARRKGFEEITSSAPDTIITTGAISERTGCINIACPGNICTGKK